VRGSGVFHKKAEKYRVPLGRRLWLAWGTGGRIAFLSTVACGWLEERGFPNFKLSFRFLFIKDWIS
jgi:hypothetical protein